MTKVEPYTIDVPQDVLDDILERLRRTRWPNEIPGTGWQRGTDLSYMKELVRYWLEAYDWRTEEARLKSPQYRQRIAEGIFNGIKKYIQSLGKGSFQ